MTLFSVGYATKSLEEFLQRILNANELQNVYLGKENWDPARLTSGIMARRDGHSLIV